MADKIGSATASPRYAQPGHNGSTRIIFQDSFPNETPISTSIVGPIFVVVVCDATGGAVAEPILKTIGVLTKSRKKYKNLYGIKLERDQP